MAIATVLALALLSSDPVAQATPADFNPRALEIFDAEPTLMRWALRDHDANRDGWLSLFEAQAATAALKRMADQDGDGHVTVREYQKAIRYVRLRYAMR